MRKKVPIVMQMEMLECGAACLAMILAYHGKWVPLEKVRLDCGISRDGSKASNILKATRGYGLAANGFRGEPENLKNITMPCIVHYNFNHFVVLTRLTDKYAYINDPGCGTVRLPFSEFDKSFTGVYFTFEKTEQFTTSGKPKSMLSFAKRRLKGSAEPFMILTFTGLLLAVFNTVNPVLSRPLCGMCSVCLWFSFLSVWRVILR